MKEILIGCLALLIPIVTFAGYGNTDWGMTPSQVVAAEKGRAKIITPAQYKIGIGKVQSENIEVSSGLYTATFIFDNDDRLIQTNLVSNEKNNAGIAQIHFNSLNKLLTQKYGEPSFKSAESVTWKTPDTTIELNKTIIPRILAQTSVRYIPNSKVDSDTSSL